MKLCAFAALLIVRAATAHRGGSIRLQLARARDRASDSGTGGSKVSPLSSFGSAIYRFSTFCFVVALGRRDRRGPSWLDYHLHEFRLLDAAKRQVVSIGIPSDEDPEDRPVLPGWEVRLSRFFERRAWHAPPAMYAYDFGDDWEHVVVHEGIESADESLTYPRCVGGARRCPPEDCGGVHGYAEFLMERGPAGRFEWD